MAIHKLELVRDDDVPIIPLRDKQYSPRPDPLYIVDATYTKRKEKNERMENKLSFVRFKHS
jgi:hypothetical protein